MKKFGTMIIKPDAMNAPDLSLIKQILKKYDLYEDNLCFAFGNYPEMIYKYRQKDIEYKNLTNIIKELPEGYVKQTPEEELKYCKIAIAAYEKYFSDTPALLLLLPVRDKNLEDFFKTMYIAKKEIRSSLKSRRNHCFAFVNYGSPNQEMKKLSITKFDDLYKTDPKSVNIAHVDGVHIEDKECFFNNFCLSFMVSTGVIKKENQKSLSSYISILNEQEQKQNK